MRLLQFVNTGLGIADTTRSLVSGSSGGVAHSVSGLSEKIDGVNAHLTSEIRSGVAAVREDIGTLSNMASTMLAQQAVLHQEIQQVIHGVSSLNTLIKKHAHVIDEQLRFVIDGPLQQACQTLMAYLVIPTNLATPTDANNLVRKKAVTLRLEKIQDLLDTLEGFIAHNFAGMQKCTTIPSEDAVPFLSQPSNADNIAFIAGRLHLLFGTKIPEKFLLLPPVSLKFYYVVATLLLKGLEKHLDLMTEDKAQTISQKILDTLKTYLEFSKFLKNHPEIIQALFDQYDYHRDRIGRILYSNQNNVSELEKSPLLFAMEERRLLLIHLIALTGKNTAFNFTSKRAKDLDSAENILALGRLSYAERRALIPATSTNEEKYRHELRLGIISLHDDRWTPYLSGSTKPGSFRTAAHNLFLNLIQEPANANDAVLSCKDSNARYDLLPYDAPSEPLPEYYISETIESYQPSWETLSDGTMVHRDIIYYPAQRSGQIPITVTHSYRPHSFYTMAMLWLYFGGDRVTEKFISERTPATRLFEFFARNTPQEVLNNWHDSNGKLHGKKTTSILPDGRDQSGLYWQMNFAKNKLSGEYAAFLKHSNSADLTTYKVLFKYYVLYFSGQLNEAESLLRKQSFNDVQKSYFLFFVSILGRRDILEAFNKIHPISNGAWVLKDTSISPLFFAVQHGNHDVVKWLLPKVNASEYSAEIKLAREQGFEDIARLIERAQVGVLPSVYTFTFTAASDYEKGLEKMCGDIAESKKKLGAYVPAPVQPVTQSAAVATSAQVVEELSDTETEAGQEKRLNNTYRKFSEERNMHFSEEKTFCAKPQARPFNRPGYRFFDRNDKTLFPDDDHFLDFHRRLKCRDYTVVTEERLADNLLVKLPLHNRAPRH